MQGPLLRSSAPFISRPLWRPRATCAKERSRLSAGSSLVGVVNCPLRGPSRRGALQGMIPVALSATDRSFRPGLRASSRPAATRDPASRRDRPLSGWCDSNTRPPGPKPGALTGLRYTPKGAKGSRPGAPGPVWSEKATAPAAKPAGARVPSTSSAHARQPGGAGDRPMRAIPIGAGSKPRPLRGLALGPVRSAGPARRAARNEHAPLTRGGLAERGGFEPPVPVNPVRQFSKLLV